MVLIETGTDIIIDGFRVALRDLVKEYRDVEAAVARGRFHAHPNALTMDGLRTFLVLTRRRWALPLGEPLACGHRLLPRVGPLAAERRKKDLDFELGHQLDAFIDLAIRARTADIQRLGNDISVFLRYPDGDMGHRPLALSSLISCVLRRDHFFSAFASASDPSPASFFLKQFLLQ